jgi:hypothetical protein
MEVTMKHIFPEHGQRISMWRIHINYQISLPVHILQQGRNNILLKLICIPCFCPVLYCCLVWFMVFNTTLSNISVISCLSVLLMEKTEVSRENHRPAISHQQTLSHNVVSSTRPHLILTNWLPYLKTSWPHLTLTNWLPYLKTSCYHTITTTMAPYSAVIWYCEWPHVTIQWECGQLVFK